MVSAPVSERPASPHDYADDHPGPAEAPGDRSLVDGVDALIADGKTYLQAELAYQKSRAGYTANRLKWSAAYGAAAFAFLHLALIALTVGIVFALSPLVGPWLATGIVVVVLLAAAAFLLMRLRGKIADMRSVFDHGEP